MEAEIAKLAKQLKNSGLAHSDLEAYRKASEIIGTQTKVNEARKTAEASEAERMSGNRKSNGTNKQTNDAASPPEEIFSGSAYVDGIDFNDANKPLNELMPEEKETVGESCDSDEPIAEEKEEADAEEDKGAEEEISDDEDNKEADEDKEDMYAEEKKIDLHTMFNYGKK